MHLFQRLLLLSFACLLLTATAVCGQVRIGLEAGEGFNLSRDTGLTSWHNRTFSTFIRTDKNRAVNFGAYVSYSYREFSTFFGPYATIRHQTNYVYLTPMFDVSYDRHHYIHFQGLLPLGVLVSGQDMMKGYLYDGHRWSTDTTVVSGSHIAKFNARIGCSLYGQLPVNKHLSILARAEYTISTNPITDYDEFKAAPSDLVFKLGMSYKP